MDTDPIKRSLDEIEQELEAAISNLNTTNQRVDDLLNEYGSGDTPIRRAPVETPDDSPPDPLGGGEDSPPEY